jgi:hypothetical protein
MTVIDLFGNDTPIIDHIKPLTIIERFRKHSHYRKSHDKLIRCKLCKNVCVNQFGNKYYKCKLIGTSHSFSTDIRAGYVCDYFDYQTTQIFK